MVVLKNIYYLIPGFLTLLLTSCVPFQNYPDHTGPLFTGDYADDAKEYDGSLKVVTWNLSFGENIDQAIDALKNSDDLKNADIVLLQEMSEVGVDAIAREIGYNYIYYPATVHTRHGENFGNAILSKYPIADHKKIILPNLRSQARIAVQAKILVEDTEVDVTNVHLETIWMIPLVAKNQAETLAEVLEISDKNLTIIGGDFNTWIGWSISYLEKLLDRIGLSRVSSGSGNTFSFAGIGLTLDHLWASEIRNYKSGVWKETKASDHYPLWVELDLKE